MSIIAMAVGQPPLSGTQNIDGVSLSEAKDSGLTTDIKGDNPTFPSIMKSMGVDQEGHVIDAQIAALIPPEGQGTDGEAVGGPLPPTGMFLPFQPQQTAHPDRIQRGDGQSGKPGAAPEWRGSKMAALVGRMGDKLTASQKGAPAVAEEDAPTRGAQISDFNSLIVDARGMKQATQRILIDMGGAAADKRGSTGPGLATQGASDVSNINVSVSHLVQGQEKPPAITAAPPMGLPLRHPEWGDELGNRITWMIRQDVQSASIKINPPNLGPLEVKVSMANDQVNVSFTSHHVAVRDALDASMPRLREMLVDSGLQLGDTNVAHRSPSDQNQASYQPFNHHNGDARVGEENPRADSASELTQEFAYVAGSGAIDIYA